jgi:8-oxo-dGTP pyrophosphatase MutT (NUDIX family)
MLPGIYGEAWSKHGFRMKTKAELNEDLARHQPFNEHESRMLARVLALVGQHVDCFERSLAFGRVTGSVWIVDTEHAHALLTHHAKLRIWLQPGGQGDGDANVLQIAMREAEEEAGLKATTLLLGGAIFAVDAQAIPAGKEEPARLHYDIRYAFEADRSLPLQISRESVGLRGALLDGIAGLNTDESVVPRVSQTRSVAMTGSRQ